MPTYKLIDSHGRIDWYTFEDTYGGWRHWCYTASCRTLSDLKVLDSVDIPDHVDPMSVLDLTRTTQHAFFLTAAAELRDCGKVSGWLSPEGVLHSCVPYIHETFAQYMFKMYASDLVRRGWLRVDSRGMSETAPNETQAAFLNAWLDTQCSLMSSSRVSRKRAGC